jgi:Spy/CpxP family protein refolding chaperone
MSRSIITLLAVLVSTIATAQKHPDPIPNPQDVNDACILNTTPEVWTSLALSEEQAQQVNAIQTGSKEEVAAAQKTGEKDPSIALAVLKDHEEQLRKVLTAEQHAKWMTWCAERPARTEVMPLDK